MTCEYVYSYRSALNQSCQTNFLVALYLVVGGGVLYHDGLEILSEDAYDKHDITDKDDDLYILIEWVGCLASVFFLVCSLCPRPIPCGV